MALLGLGGPWCPLAPSVWTSSPHSSVSATEEAGMFGREVTLVSSPSLPSPSSLQDSGRFRHHLCENSASLPLILPLSPRAPSTAVCVPTRLTGVCVLKRQTFLETPYFGVLVTVLGTWYPPAKCPPLREHIGESRGSPQLSCGSMSHGADIPHPTCCLGGYGILVENTPERTPRPHCRLCLEQSCGFRCHTIQGPALVCARREKACLCVGQHAGPWRGGVGKADSTLLGFPAD